ncbi:ATPase [Paenibacillus antibioticophila]|uniref:ATPase n=1 Tax=Paenibacillus antibioticophila TaxID=1274374 RepID=A0A919XUS3_9BACL|nr:MoxR family ATPase [Paenibacillus antibioticophila]GIO39527.1 ATPase [Paenibacillus antibioticophila]
MKMQDAMDMARRIRNNIAQVIVGKEEVIDLLLAALLGNGHVLLEDVPGTGKTLLAKALARSMDGSFRRIQFTPDLLPSDLSGINFYNQKSGEFEFRPGPLFTEVLLADEINRATPRTQSSLLECMEERQVTIDGVTHELAGAFFVMATQNPIDNQGTFPLPEAQLDRFLMRITMGYPSYQEGIDILERYSSHNPLLELTPAASAKEISEAQQRASEVHVTRDLLGYIVALTEATRKHPEVRLGASPRASGALLRAAKGYAFVQGRDYVVPDDIKAIAVPVLAHRLLLRQGLNLGESREAGIIRQILNEVTVPAEENAKGKQVD